MPIYLDARIVVLPIVIALFIVAMVYRFLYYYLFGGKQREQRKEAARLAEIDQMLERSRRGEGID